MELFNEIAAVQARIAQITGQNPPAASGPTGDFSAMVKATLAANDGYGDPNVNGLDPSSDTKRGPAPIPPAEINQLVSSNASAYGVDPNLVKAIIANESGFNANATSQVGAQGLMQLMPSTAAGLGVGNAYDPAQNVAGGTKYLRGLLDRFGGNVRLAVAAYNAGPGAVQKYGGVPPYAETQNYVQNVLSSYDKYRSSP